MQKQTLISTPAPLSSKLIQRSGLFSTLSESLLQEMTEHFKAERWHKKSMIDHHLLQKRFFILMEGRIEVMRTNQKTGRSVTLEILHPGDSFDIITLLDGKDHDVIHEPLEELKVISVSLDKMRSWIWQYPELNRQFMPYLAKRMRDQEGRTADLVLYDTLTRLSRIILKNLDRSYNYRGLPQDAHQDYLLTGMSDEVLARLTGSVRQVINQHLQKWKKEGIIEKNRNRIEIKNLQAIMDQAEFTGSRYR